MKYKPLIYLALIILSVYLAYLAVDDFLGGTLLALIFVIVFGWLFVREIVESVRNWNRTDGRFIDRVINFLDTLYNLQGPTVKVPEVERLLLDKNFKNVIPYLVFRDFIEITYKEENNKDFSIRNISHVHLKDPGMEFLIDYKNREAQKEFSRIIALTGAIVALVYFYNFLITILDGKFQVITLIIFFILLLLCFIPIVNFIWKEFNKK